jgi:hypothetical protein
MGNVGKDIGNIAKVGVAIANPALGLGLLAADKLLGKKKKGAPVAAGATPEQQIISNLLAKSKGEGPFVADIKGEQDLAKAQSQAMSMGSSFRGVSPTTALRMSMANHGQNMADITANTTLGRVQEANDAANVALGGINAEKQAQLQAKGLKDQRRASERNMWGNVVGSAATAAAMFFSDENVKENVKPGSKSVRKFLDTVNAHEYDYKSEEFGAPGKHVSVMAQELEKTETGQKMVINTPKGKIVDYNKGLPMMLAAQADLHKRLTALEGKGVQKFYKGGEVQQDARPLPVALSKGGHVVPGKAKVEGDSELNDVVPALLSPGEFVIPRSVAKKSPEQILKFIKKIKAEGAEENE